MAFPDKDGPSDVQIPRPSDGLLSELERELSILKQKYAILEQDYLVAKRVRESLEARLARSEQRATNMDAIGVLLQPSESAQSGVVGQCITCGQSLAVCRCASESAERPDVDSLLVGFRRIEATLGVLDHSEAIDDENKLVDHVCSKVSTLVSHMNREYLELFLAASAIKATTEVLELPPAEAEIKRLIRAVSAIGPRLRPRIPQPDELRCPITAQRVRQIARFCEKAQLILASIDLDNLALYLERKGS